MKEMRMPFGKWGGFALSQVPFTYLRWCLEEAERIPDDVRQALQHEMDRRMCLRPPDDYVLAPDDKTDQAKVPFSSPGRR
jgi:hypothetical protein